MEQRTKKRGDRFDGYWLRDEAPALGQFMAYLMPNRADNEAHINVDIDCRPLDAFLARKNEGRTEDKYTYFHLFLAATVKCFVLRPRMNRFISGNRLYMRDHISVSFVVKKRFEDKAEEGLAYKRYGENDTIDTRTSPRRGLPTSDTVRTTPSTPCTNPSWRRFTSAAGRMSWTTPPT